MSTHPVATQSPSVEEPVNLPEPQSLTRERLRAWSWHRQGLDGSLAGCTAEQVFDRAGWARSVGGANPYLTLFARAGIRREQVDADVLAHRILELPVARGCTYVLGRKDFAWALKLGKDAAEAVRVLGRLGVDRGEITLLEEQVLHVLAEAEGPMDPRQLKEELGDSVRNLGEEGKKKGATTTLPTALGILQSQGKIRRVPANGRLDQQRYAYEPWDLAPSGIDDDAARTELIRRYLGWTGGATLKQSQWFTGFTVAQSKAALAAVGAVEVPTALPADPTTSQAASGGDALWMLPDDVGRLASFDEPADEQIQLLAGTDSLFLLRRNAADLLAEEDQHKPALESLALQADLPDHPILDRGRIIGLWQYEPAKERIVPWLFHGPTPAVTQRIAEVEAWIREDLGDFRAFSLDSPASRQKRTDALAASAEASAAGASAAASSGGAG
ncbi:DNA glycosylase AlkZ-like family protein [Arthrobacter sp. NPDC058130]|uniref:DNA glycosylase AlkZ-like family protein n=1 Tax=Arthrobacter sp. NPDC058130 TaxID=3346353 RepID=UPI0036ED355E